MAVIQNIHFLTTIDKRYLLLSFTDNFSKQTVSHFASTFSAYDLLTSRTYSKFRVASGKPIMASNLGRPPLSLKQFMLRNQVLALYRNILRAIKEVPNKEDQKYLKDWARSDFDRNKHHTDEITIKMMIKHGERSLKELQQSLEMSRG